jgi:hypothetical protein
MSRTLHRIASAVPAVLLAVLLTACGTAPAASTAPPADTPAAAPTATANDTSQDDTTAAIVDITWAQTSETDKDNMCAGIDLLGTDWAAEQMREGAGDDSVDWDQAAVLIQDKCALR